MTLQEFCEKYNYSEKTIHRSFKRTVETFKHKGLILEREGTWNNGNYIVREDPDFRPAEKPIILSTRLKGARFGHLTVIEDTGERFYRSIVWRCKCDCGREHKVTSNNLNGGQVKSCGHIDCPYHTTYKDLSNQKFGKLTALYPTSMKDGNHMYWMCKCDCGNAKLKEVASNHLIRGNIQSCGCIKSSIGEDNIEKILIVNNLPYQKQVQFDDLKNQKPLRYDFGIYDKDTHQIKRLIEFDGIQHYEEQEYFTSSLAEIQHNDEIKNQYAKNHNIPLVRIPYTYRDKITLEMIMGKDFEI